MRHTAIVYLHKAETIRTGKKPTHGWPPVSIGSLPPQALLAHAYAQLKEQFDAHEPGDPAETWVPDDQTVGFWIRRLTHETVIHRFDLEDALGEPTTPIDPELAVDGVDEVLVVMLGRGRPDADASGGTVRLEADAHAWDVQLDKLRTTVVRGAPANGQASVRADAELLLLWLWGRAPQLDADPGHHGASELRARLAKAL